MNRDEYSFIGEQASVIAERLNDQGAIRLHCLAVKTLGFQRCYEISSEVLQLSVEGRIRTNVRKYYNAYVMNEIRKVREGQQ